MVLEKLQAKAESKLVVPASVKAEAIIAYYTLPLTARDIAEELDADTQDVRKWIREWREANNKINREEERKGWTL